MTCADTERLLELRSAELLSTQDAALLDAHLSGCGGCRERSVSLEALLNATRLPPFSVAEEKRMAELSGMRPLRKRERPVLRWVATSAALAASALLGLHFGNAPSRSHPSSPEVATRAARPQVPAASARRELSNDATSLDVVASLDTEGDSALYDAVAFQGGTMPFDLDNE